MKHWLSSFFAFFGRSKTEFRQLIMPGVVFLVPLRNRIRICPILINPTLLCPSEVDSKGDGIPPKPLDLYPCNPFCLVFVVVVVFFKGVNPVACYFQGPHFCCLTKTRWLKEEKQCFHATLRRNAEGKLDLVLEKSDTAALRLTKAPLFLAPWGSQIVFRRAMGGLVRLTGG